ncbi:MAG: zincin-like metallopeptidase domain-containing protein [Oscillospiraceae bacterium]
MQQGRIGRRNWRVGDWSITQGWKTEKSLRNSAAYVQSWLNVLKNDKRFIVSASGKAEKAVELHSCGSITPAHFFKKEESI